MRSLITSIINIQHNLQILKHDDGEEYDDELLSDDELSRHGSTRSTKSSTFYAYLTVGILYQYKLFF